MEQVVLKSEEGIVKSDNFYYKMGQVSQSGAIFITTQGRYYKLGQLPQGKIVHPLSLINYLRTTGKTCLHFFRSIK